MFWGGKDLTEKPLVWSMGRDAPINQSQGAEKVRGNIRSSLPREKGGVGTVCATPAPTTEEKERYSPKKKTVKTVAHAEEAPTKKQQQSGAGLGVGGRALSKKGSGNSVDQQGRRPRRGRRIGCWRYGKELKEVVVAQEGVPILWERNLEKGGEKVGLRSTAKPAKAAPFSAAKCSGPKENRAPGI